MTTTLFSYLYRDSDNYNASGVIALRGEEAPKRWKAALAKLEMGEFFVAEQLRVPPLYHALYKWSGGQTWADHCWHTFEKLEVVQEVGRDAYHWGDAKAFVSCLLAVDQWRCELSPHFGLYAVETFPTAFSSGGE